MLNGQMNLFKEDVILNKLDKTTLFYYKDKKKQIVPFPERSKHERARERLKELFSRFQNDLPRKFRDNWSHVKLYDPGGDVEDAHAVILQIDEGSYDLNNKLNHVTGKEWTIFSCSWFIFNALKKDLD